VLTRPASSQLGYRLTFGENGKLLSTQKQARPLGTTMQISKLFNKLPVRRKNFEKNQQREFKKTIKLIHNYCLMYYKIKFTIRNNGKVYQSIPHSKTMLDRLPLVIPSQKSQNFLSLSVDGIDGIVCRPDTGSTAAPDRTSALKMLFVNNRPVNHKKAEQVIGDVWRLDGGYRHQSPLYCLNFTVHTGEIDVNVTPDKKTVCIASESQMLEKLSNALKEIWGTEERQVEASKTVIDFFEPLKPPTQEPQNSSQTSPAKRPHSENNTSFIEDDAPGYPSPLKIPKIVQQFILSEAAVGREPAEKSSDDFIDDFEMEELLKQVDIEDTGRDWEEKSCGATVGSEPKLVDVEPQQHPLPQTTEKPRAVKIAVEKVEQLCEDIVAETSKQLHKKDFKKMKPVGQFNKAFIVTKIEDELYLIDQHAADEKARFEHYSDICKISCQPLTCPLKLNLDELEREFILKHQNGALKRNRFLFDENLNLTHLPVFQNYQLKVTDFREVLAALMDDDAPEALSQTIKPRKIRYKLASKACRTAIMVGDALTDVDMVKVVSRLSTLERPWNCPHGRPTCRHLATVKGLGKDTLISERRDEFKTEFLFENK